MNGQRHRYTVELRLYARFDPDAVTADTGLRPCDVRQPECGSDGEMLRLGLWAYNGGGQSGAYAWNTLQEGLEFVLERASGFSEVFKKHRGDGIFTWWCGHFQSSFDGGPTLTPDVLRRLGDFGADLFIDNYFSPDDGPRDPR